MGLLFTVCCLPQKCLHVTFNLFQVTKLQCGYVITWVAFQHFEYGVTDSCKSQSIVLGGVPTIVWDMNVWDMSGI